MNQLKRLILIAVLALVGCEATENHDSSPEYTGFIHIDLLKDGVVGDSSTGLNIHFTFDGAPLEDPIFDCWAANEHPDWGESDEIHDDPILSTPLGGALRQQLVYRFPLGGIYGVFLTNDWSDFTGEATLTLSYDNESGPVHSVTLPIAPSVHAFDVSWPSREVDATVTQPH